MLRCRTTASVLRRIETRGVVQHHQQQQQQQHSYFTNANNVKRDDPYAVLGLSWGDGATTKEIQSAFRQKAAKLHPDVNREDSPAVALRKFQELQKAYETLMKIHSNLSGVDSAKDDEWRFSVWRSGDRIALDRTDVAGAMRKRPVMPAKAKETFAGAQLGHPSGRGRHALKNEYLGDGKSNVSSSVGRGTNKWVKPKEFKPWNGATKIKRASDFKNNQKEEKTDDFEGDEYEVAANA